MNWPVRYQRPTAEQASAVPKYDFIVGEVVCVVRWHPRKAEISRDFSALKLDPNWTPEAGLAWTPDGLVQGKYH